MAEVTPESTPTLEALQKVSSKTRRLRPPDIHDTAAGNENRVPLRAEKLGRRESRLGLRGLFARNKTSSQNVRASVADLGNWPYSFSTTRSDINLPPDLAQQLETGPTAKPNTKTPGTPTTSASQARRPIQPRTKLPTAPPSVAASSTPKAGNQGPSPPSRPARGSLAAWDPPPLFQAYPQAIKHARLHACTTSIEVLMRLQSSHGGGTSSSTISVRESSLAESAGDIAAADRGFDKTKRRHRRNTSASSTKLDWSSKIYVFVTSGYLLQYAGEGSFDRLPEKMLHIGKDSAAFASDLIPGRHWVLQVCSDTDAVVPLTPDSRSLFSRLPFRSGERRHASALLMVFESAEDMENWLSTLRREIEHLGGKKHLSETGNPKANDRVLQLKGRPSQRTLVVRDPERFSRTISPQEVASPPWRLDSALGIEYPTPDIHLEAPIVLKVSREIDPSADDMSVTNSLVSQDGRQLESLRESANRLSFISSGQRTVVTSECSSPPCSPVCDSFTSSNADEPSSTLTDSPKEVGPHPNIARASKYSLSIQTPATSDPLLDFRFPMPAGHPKPPTHLAQPAPLPLRSHTVAFCNGDMPAPHSRTVLSPVRTPNSPGFCISPTMPLPAVPNFSVPHKSSKRLSVDMKSPSLSQTQSIVPLTAPTSAPPQTELPAPPQKLPLSRPGMRRLPPPSLAFSRPLSVVPDQPSPPPKSPEMSRSVTQAAIETYSGSPGCSDVIDTPSLLGPFELSASTEQDPSPQTLVSKKINPRASPVEASPERVRIKTFALPSRGTMPSLSSAYSSANPHKEGFRPSSAMDLNRRSSNRSLMKGSDAKPVHYKRTSMFAQPGEVLPRPTESKLSLSERPSDAADIKLSAARNRFLERREQHVPRPSASNVHLRTHSTPQKALSYRRRSMSQLAEGPPPAPPPTCALPPLPPSFCSVRGRRGA